MRGNLLLARFATRPVIEGMPQIVRTIGTCLVLARYLHARMSGHRDRSSATAAANQMASHIAQLIAFSANGWDITERLDILLKVVLTTLALRLVVSAMR